MLTYPKSHFSEEYISAPRGCCAPKFLHALENHSSLTSAPPTGDGGPPYNFFQRGVKNWLRMEQISAYNFGVRGCSPTKLWHLTCLYVGVLMQVQILGAPPPLKFGRAKNKKRSKIGALYNMLTYPKSTMRVRRMPMHLSSGHVTLVPRKFPPVFTPLNFPQSDLGRRVDSRWALPQISSLECSLYLWL